MMSFREKSAWVSLVTTLIVWGYYLVALAGALGSGDPDGGSLLGLFVRCTVALVMIQIVVAIALALHSPREAKAPADERERMIALKATRIAYPVLILLVMGVTLALPGLSVAGPLLFPRDPMDDALLLIGSGTFFALVIADLVHSVAQIVYFRLSA